MRKESPLILSKASLNSNNDAICLGNFDGLHKGHFHIISEFFNSCPKGRVYSFLPHPNIFLKKEVALLTSLDEKNALFRDLFSTEELYYIKFDDYLSQLCAYEFLDHLANEGVKKIYVGHDFSFGKDQKNINDIHHKSVEMIELNKFLLRNNRVSSSMIRAFVRNADLEEAHFYLGYHYFIQSKVIHGHKIGGDIGFPTVNQEIDVYKLLPPLGVYLTSCFIPHLKMSFNSVTNIGKRPTFHKDEDRVHVETHIFDQRFQDMPEKNKILYGDLIIISFKKKIREEKKFNSLEDLVQQIRVDINEAKKNNE